MKQKITPYNTGKVQIGKHYTPPRRVEYVSEDMEDLQSVLLGNRRILAEKVVKYLGVAFIVAVIAMDMFVWRPN